MFSVETLIYLQWTLLTTKKVGWNFHVNEEFLEVAYIWVRKTFAYADINVYIHNYTPKNRPNAICVRIIRICKKVRKLSSVDAKTLANNLFTMYVLGSGMFGAGWNNLSWRQLHPSKVIWQETYYTALMYYKEKPVTLFIVQGVHKILCFFPRIFNILRPLPHKD